MKSLKRGALSVTALVVVAGTAAAVVSHTSPPAPSGAMRLAHGHHQGPHHGHKPRLATYVRGPETVPKAPAGRGAIAANGSVLGAPAPAPSAPSMAMPQQPNIVMITSDDMSVSDLPYMPHVRHVLMDKGTVMRDAIAPTSLCVPARASLLTGQYATNHGDYAIAEGRHGGFDGLPSGNTLPVWLHEAGYNTYFTGKYLNGYGVKNPRYVPPGWTDWRATVDESTYNFFNTVVNHDGHLLHQPGTYSTDLVRAQSFAQLDEQRSSQKPFFQWISYVAPHSAGPREPGDPMRTQRKQKYRIKTTVPAPRDKGRFKNLPLPHNPAMFEADTSDKPAASPARGYIDPHGRAMLRIDNEQRIEALQDVDRSVAATVARIKAMGQLSRTVFIFGSDNGYVTGQHNISGKLWEYDDIIRIPMVLRGPGIPAGKVSSTPVSNPDIATTIAALAHAHPGRVLDGVDIMPRIADRDLVRVVPIIAWPVNNGNRPPLYTGVRVGTWTYVRYRKGGQELYDRSVDPWEVTNLARIPRYRTQLTQMRNLTAKYTWCKGQSCPHTYYLPPSAGEPGGTDGLPAAP
ncbi:MAG: sulfatase family protein [Marmoricola sp.]